MIVFVHTKFGLVRNLPPRSDRVFQIPVQIGLNAGIRNFLESLQNYSFLPVNSRES